MPVTMVQNEMAGPTILSLDPKGSLVVEWAGKGDPAGGDVQPVPEAIVESVQFSKAIRRRVISLVNADSSVALEALEKQANDYAQRTDVASASAISAIEPETQNDLVVENCIGPSPRGNGTCGIDVTVREKTKNDAAVLCSQHEGLRSEYVPTQVQEGSTVVTKWIRAGMGPREHGES